MPTGSGSEVISGVNSDSGGADLLFYAEDNNYPGCRVFSKAEILRATNDYDRQIATGGFGTVFVGKITHQFGEIDVAVKRYTNDPLLHMRHELHHIMSVPPHRHLIRAIGKCEEEDCVCIVLPLLTPLLNGVNFVPLTEQERLQVCCDVTEAVVHLHSVRRLHRDIKPHNILLDSQKRAVLTDLGVTEEVSATKPRGGFTPSYAPPEWTVAPASQFSGDIFCLGLTITSIVALREPAIDTTDRQALIGSLQPASLQQLVRQMVDDNQARRPVAVDVRWQLSQLQASGVAVSSLPGAPERALGAQAADDGEHAPAADAGRHAPAVGSAGAATPSSRPDVAPGAPERALGAQAADDGEHAPAADAGRHAPAVGSAGAATPSSRPDVAPGAPERALGAQAADDGEHAPVADAGGRELQGSAGTAAASSSLVLLLCLVLWFGTSMSSYSWNGINRVVSGAVEEIQVRRMMDYNQARRPVASTTATATQNPLSNSKLDKYPPRFSCSAEVAIERVDALNKIRDAFANRNDDRLVLLYGPHGVGKTIAAAQYCKHRKQQQRSDKKNIIAAQVQASTLRESLRDMFDIPIDSDKITFDDIRKTMDAIYDRLPADDKNTRICLLVDDLSCTDEETATNFVFLSKSKLIDGIVATVPTESTPNYYEDCQLVQMTAFSVDDTLHLARNVLGGDDDDATSALLQQRGVDKDSAQALLDACDKKPFLVHRALEQFSDNIDPTTVKLADFIAKKLTPQNLASSPRSKYEHTLKSISTLQVDAFRKHFKMPVDVVTPLELLLTACKKLQIQEFDMQFLRLVLRVDGSGSSSDSDAKLTEWIKWMKSNIGLVHNLADSTFKLHYLQSIGNPLFDGAMDWEHAAVLSQLKESYDDALKLTTAWISSKPDDELQALDKLTIAFCVVARTCGLYRSNPTEAPTEKALSLWQRLEAAWKEAAKPPLGTSAEIASRGAVSLSGALFYDAKYQAAAHVSAVALRFAETEELRANLLDVRGFSVIQLGQPDEGIALQQEALEMRRRIHRGVNDPDLAASLNNVGISLEQMGKREEGVALKKEALEMYRRIHGGVDHHRVATALNNVGFSLFKMGKRDEGVALQHEALEMRRRIHRGVDHPDLAASLNNVGMSLFDMGEREEGISLQQEALEMRRRLGLTAQHDYVPFLSSILDKTLFSDYFFVRVFSWSVLVGCMYIFFVLLCCL